MSLLLSCQSVGKSFGAQPLFSNISMAFSREDRLGLIGPNGSGKSTFLKILAGLMRQDEGELSVRKDTKLVYLSQEDDLAAERTVEQILLEALSGGNIEDAERYNRVQRWMARAEFADPEQRVDTLSGGRRKRLAITAAFVREPDMLLMDEPTNHLDLEGILWLEELLQNPPFAFVLVSHDRYFLENIVTRIVELNTCFPQGYLKVDGSYSEYLFYREAFLDNQTQLEAVLANKVRRETEWLQRGPKARTTKARFRIEEAYRLRDEFVSVRKRNLQNGNVGFDFDTTGRKTKKLMTVKKVGHAMGGNRLFSDIDLTLSPKKCLGLLGRNGSGKSTLIDILAGRLAPDEGRVELADGAKVVVFDQKREQLDQAESLRRALSPAGDSVVYRGRSIHVASWAKRFLFSADQLELPVNRLSGGEQARILIARLMLQPADILLLDEPTNDLDIPSLEVLEESLKEFPGASVLVTHDRFLLDRLADTVLGLDGRGGAGLYADFGQWVSARKPQKEEKKVQKSQAKPRPPKMGKLSYKDQRELDQIEAKIMEAEAAVEECQKHVLDPETANKPALLEDWCNRLQQRQETVERLYERWEELERRKNDLRS
ncbi:MAG: ABC-F family ATP-binding cassette domain-containing protein [Proteobacteria bacterium]|nr:ABC-F family ATP-binding cassette domain-containing protein [Pseudomonadota bacterium]